MIRNRTVSSAATCCIISLLLFTSPAVAAQELDIAPTDQRDEPVSHVSSENEFKLTVEDLQVANLVQADGERSFGDDSFLYGAYDLPISYEAIALAELGINPFEASDSEMQAISEQFVISDSAGNLSRVGFNVKPQQTGTSMILVGAHTRASLSLMSDSDRTLSDDCVYVITVEDDLICQNRGGDSGYFVESGIEIREGVFQQLLRDDRLRLLGKDRYKLNELETENKIALNNLLSFAEIANEDLHIGAYSGQTRAGYGSITSPTAYLKDRYGGTWTRFEGASLSMPSFKMSAFDAISSHHCVPTAITRTFAHARDSKKFTKITSNNTSLFREVRTVALKDGFKEGGPTCKTCGVAPNKIEGMIERVGDDQGYPKTDSKWIGSFTWNGTVKSSIAEKNPMLLTFVSGTYKSHAVTVTGWAAYKTSSGKVAKMISVYDGWDGAIRWVDYDAFTAGADFSLASFFPVIVK